MLTSTLVAIQPDGCAVAKVTKSLVGCENGQPPFIGGMCVCVCVIDVGCQGSRSGHGRDIENLVFVY